MGDGRFKEEMKQLLSDERRKNKVLFIPQQNIETLPNVITTNGD